MASAPVHTHGSAAKAFTEAVDKLVEIQMVPDGIAGQFRLLNRKKRNRLNIRQVFVNLLET